MSTSTIAITPRRRIWIRRLSIFVIAGLVGVILASIISGYGLNFRGFGRAVLNVVYAIRDHQVVTADQGDVRNIVFLHHSVGENLIAQGGLRERLSAADYRFWDQNYNWPGLTDPDGNLTGYSYNIPNDNTDPDGLLTIFSQPLFGLPLNTLSGLMQHEVIAFKSCFPASNIANDAQLAERKEWYLRIRDFIDEHPEKLFVVITQPPLNPAETNRGAAVRARAFADWLKSDEFLGGRSNIATFDLFDQFAESDPQASDFNMLRADYRDGADSHPNRLGNETVGPILADFIRVAAEQYRATSAR